MAKRDNDRCVVVIDRGWIYAGDVHQSGNWFILERVVWLFNWRAIGLDGVIKNPKAKEADLRKMPGRLRVPADAVIYCLEVPDEWGL